jgi:hypothetical protein
VWAGDRSFSLSLLGAFAGLTALFVALGPGGTSALSLPASVLYWGLHIGIGLLLCVASMFLLARASGMPAWLVVVLSGLLASLLFAPLGLLIDRLFPLPQEAPDSWIDRWEQAGPPRALVAEWLQLAPEFVLAWLLVNLPQRGAVEARPPGAADTGHPAPGTGSMPGPRAAASDPGTAAGALAGRLPPAIGRDVVSVSADLHYLHVHTVLGKATLLGTLEEAEQLLGEPGLRIHRSHLVNCDHVRRVLRKGSGWLVETTTGTKLPVSRRRMAAVRARLGRDFARDA